MKNLRIKRHDSRNWKLERRMAKPDTLENENWILVGYVSKLSDLSDLILENGLTTPTGDTLAEQIAGLRQDVKQAVKEIEQWLDEIAPDILG